MVIACGIEHGATDVHPVPLPVCETKMIVVAVGVASGLATCLIEQAVSNNNKMPRIIFFITSPFSLVAPRPNAICLFLSWHVPML